MGLPTQNNQNSGDKHTSNFQSDALASMMYSSVSEITKLSLENQTLRTEVDSLRQQLKDYQRSIESSTDKIEDITQKMGGLSERTEELTSDIKNTRDKTLEPLAVFVGLFTFVSVGFNIFANVKDQSVWISLLLIIAGIVVIFSSLVIHAGSLATKENNRRLWTGSLIVVGFLIMTVGTVIHLIFNSPDAQKTGAMQSQRANNEIERSAEVKVQNKTNEISE